MYLDMIRTDEKVMESCWYSLCVYKNKRKKEKKNKKKKKRDTKVNLHCEKRRNEKLKRRMKNQRRT